MLRKLLVIFRLDFLNDRPLIKAFEIFHPKKLPQKEQSLVMYGEQEVSLLCEKYSSVVKKDEALVESEGFKHEMKMSYQSYNTLDLLSHLVGDECLIQLYPNLLVIAQIVMVFPASSVDCERGFSVQNHIKTKNRNRLASKHLDVLVRVRL